jgi:pimeloyl-ACP methyl ester carboxylesterase
MRLNLASRANAEGIAPPVRARQCLVAVACLLALATSCADSTTDQASPSSSQSAPTAAAPTTVPATASANSSTISATQPTTTTTLPAAGPEPKPCGPVDYQFPAELYPFTDRCIDLGFGDYHYFDESPEGTPKGIALMVHGNPTSSFVYRDVATNLLANRYRVVAVDHYGFGESAHPSIAEFGYAPSDHSKVLTDFVDALDIDNVTLVVQDWGGPIGLTMAVNRPERIKNIVIMNTWAWQITEADESGVFGPAVRWSLTNTQLSEQLLKTGRVISGAADMLAAPYEEPLATEVKNAYLGPFFDAATGQLRSATIAEPTGVFTRSVLDDTATFDALGTLAPIVDKPVYFYFGGQDPLFGALLPNDDGACAAGTPAERDGQVYCADAAGERIYPYVDRFTSLWNPEMVKGAEINPTAGHFVQEAAPDRVSEIVLALNT